MGGLIISESERIDILRQYKLILEQKEVARDPLVIDKVITFPAGYHSAKYLTDLVPEIEKITQYLKSSKGKTFVVNVEMSSGESQIPNNDVETKDEDGKTQGWLAQKRQTSITQYITDQLQSYVEGGLLASLPQFTVNPISIGRTPWVGQTFVQPNREKYLCTEKESRSGCVRKYNACKQSSCRDIAQRYASEQYIRVNITLNEKIEKIPEEKKCLDNMTIEVNYTKNNHNCNAAVYKIFINGILLTRDDGKPFASLNNDKINTNKELDYYNNDPKTGGQRYNKFIITPEIATELLKGGKDSFTISAMCWNPLGYSFPNWGYGCHEGVGTIIVTNGKGEKSTYESATPRERDETKTLVTINACGKKELIPK
jgi:hypothetical protein